MLALTENAIDAINDLAPGDAGVRLFLSDLPGMAGQTTFQAAVASEPARDDDVVEADGAHVFLEPRASALLEDKMLDAAVDGGSVRFAVADRT